jgi:hypothetical protein
LKPLIGLLLWIMNGMHYKKISFEKPLDGLLVDLLLIFRKGDPNYINLGSLFGIEKTRVEDKNKIIYIVNQVNWKENDITNVTMFLDPDSHKITEIYIYTSITSNE